jgi:hypothetical protein
VISQSGEKDKKLILFSEHRKNLSPPKKRAKKKTEVEFEAPEKLVNQKTQP